MRFIVQFLVTPVTLLLAAHFIPGVMIDSLYTALIIAVLLGVLNILVRPVLLLFSLPVTIVTLGLFVFLLDAAILWFIASFVQGFAFTGFLPALIVTILLAVAHWLADMLS